jgi:hypothetical protein
MVSRVPATGELAAHPIHNFHERMFVFGKATQEAAHVLDHPSAGETGSEMLD